jgi:hypothetical protein
MICVFSHDDEIYIVKDGKPPNIRLSVFEPRNFPLLVNADLNSTPPWYVCSKNLISSNQLKASTPESLLALFRSILDEEDSRGGPRPLSEHDKVCCRLRLQVRESSTLKSPVSSRILGTIAKHPAFHGGLGFMCADVICAPMVNTLNAIYDIRRFVARDVGRTRNKLRSYFRMTNPETLIKAHNKASEYRALSVAEARLLWLAYSWQLPTEYFSQNVINAMPHMFLMREFHNYIDRFREQGNADDEATDLGVFRTTLRALEFINLTWLSGLNYVKFDPFKFFKLREEAEAFSDYIDMIS